MMTLMMGGVPESVNGSDMALSANLTRAINNELLPLVKKKQQATQMWNQKLERLDLNFSYLLEQINTEHVNRVHVIELEGTATCAELEQKIEELESTTSTESNKVPRWKQK